MAELNDTEMKNIVELTKLLIREPDREFKLSDLKPTLTDMSEDSIRKVLQLLKKKGICGLSFSRGRPKGGNRLEKYLLQKEIKVYEVLFRVYYETDNKCEFLASNYNNDMIEKFGYLAIYNIVKNKFELATFRKNASDAILNLSSIKEEYKKVAYNLREEISRNGFIQDYELKPEYIAPIRTLNDFEPMQSIRLYRETIHETVLEAYKDLATRSIISEGVHSFLAFDTYLSPLSSYPVNDLSQLLLLPYPFQRIYEDAYLIDGDAFSVLSSRAAAIYNFFSDFILESLKIIQMPNDIDQITKQMIFYWNVASTRFDVICGFLGELYENDIGSGNYHLKSDGLRFQIIDMQTDKQLIPKELERDILLSNIIPSLPDDLHIEQNASWPFEFLRPCEIFKHMDNDGQPWNYEIIHYETILEEINLKLNSKKLSHE